MIRGVAGAFRAEARRSLGTPSGRLVLLLPPAVAAGRVLVGSALSRADRATDLARSTALGGEPIGVELSSNAYPPFAAGLAVGVGVAAFLLLVHGASSLAAERESGTLRAALVSGVSRSQLVLGKAAFGVVLVLAALAGVTLVSFAAAAIPYEYGPVVEQGYVIYGLGTLHVETLRGLGAAAVALLATHAFGLFVSSLSRAPGGAVAAAILLFLLFDAGKGFLGGASEWVFATFVPSLADRSYLGEVVQLAKGYSDAGFEAATWTKNLLVSPAEAALLVAGAVVATIGRDA